jgi:hypothetical protein
MTYRLPYHIVGLLFLAACKAPPVVDPSTSTPVDTVPDPGLEPVCTEAAEIACVDDIISDLSLHDDKEAPEGSVVTDVDGDDFVTTIDATAGGFGNETANAWTYLKFTERGAEQVQINDEKALESTKWHLAARRFILRLNGGSSGPSCVGAVPFLEDDYEDMTAVVEDLEYTYDDYYTDNCTLINDSSGLEGSPQVALSPWWEYPGCVATTATPFQVQLEDGHVIKLVVEQYYGVNQDVCNDQGLAGSDSAMITMRWTFLK